MKRAYLIPLAALIAVAGCGKKAEVASNAVAPEEPQITDIEGLPVDRSAEITSIDASTGDASGMPADGGKAIALPKQAAAVPPTNEAAPLVTSPPVVTMPPLVTPPPPAATTTPGGAN